MAKLKGLMIIYEVNGTYEDIFIAWPWARRISWLFTYLTLIQMKLATAIIAVTSGLAKWVKSETNKAEIFVIPNGADLDLFHPWAKTDIPLPENYVVFFGALTSWQGIDTMLSAVEMSNWPETVRLVIIGEGREKSKVQEYANMYQSVLYLGRLRYVEMPGIVSNSIAGLSTQNNIRARSNTGLYPLKVFETLACGVPIIVSDFPGQAEIVSKNRCGLVIKAENPGALAKAVHYLYKHPEKCKKMGIRGREFILREASWDKRAAQTAEVIHQILD